ncbi:ASST-domain-containing protein [Dactylonectria estremocensis]|uniref:ASST-domain-containing protein n=1 Tax=Dactylonectria estremocensis TaxID=1079267 RepID=A0A9P9E2D8_9HYPO|nr:ASST-domain-containing protein [Dactylonectria estremocensis]
MISFCHSAWVPRLITLSLFANALLIYYYLFLTPEQPTSSTASSSAFLALPILPSENYREIVTPDDQSIWPYRVFKSSLFTPPHFSITTNGGAVADGYIFITPEARGGNGPNQSLPLIMTQDGDLVYCWDQVGLRDFQVQSIKAKPYLTSWQGIPKVGHGYGEWVTMDDGYIKSSTHLDIQVNTRKEHINPTSFMDFHEHEVTPEGTVLVTAYNTTTHDLSSVGGPVNGWVVDSLLFEIDIETSEVVYSWSALDHINIANSKLSVPSNLGDGTEGRPYDFFHLNSIQPVGEEQLGDFGPLPPEGQFRYQHHARAHDVTSNGFRLSLFDNHNRNGDSGAVTSRSIMLDVKLPPSQDSPPRILHTLEPHKSLYANSQGSYQADLSNGNGLLGYGQIPVITEYGPSGDSNDIRWEARFGNDNTVDSYRAFKSEWKATPKEWPPSLVYEKDGSDMKAYVSWNGATDVQQWHLYEEEVGVGLTAIGRAFAHGFETAITIPATLFARPRCIVAVAVQDDRELLYSNTACFQ